MAKLEGIDPDKNLIISGLDILDGSPVIDIKPYLPMWDSLENANNGWIDQTPKLQPVPVNFKELSKETFNLLSQQELKALEQTLCWDPRPAYTKDNNRTFIHQIYDLEVTWKKTESDITIVALKRL